MLRWVHVRDMSACWVTALVGFMACPVVVERAQTQFCECWNAVRGAAAVRLGSALVPKRIGERVAACFPESTSSVNAESRSVGLVEQVRQIIETHFAQLRAQAVTELSGHASNASPDVQRTLEEHGVTMYVVQDNHSKHGAKQRAVHSNLSSFCATLLVVMHLWAPRVHSVAEIPPSLVTAIVRCGGHFGQWFSALASHPPQYNHHGDPLWIEHSLCVGLYRLALSDATSERESPKSSESDSGTASMEGSPADVDSDSENSSLQESIMRRVDEWRSSKRVRPSEYALPKTPSVYQTETAKDTQSMLVSSDEELDPFVVVNDSAALDGDEHDDAWPEDLPTVSDSCGDSVASSCATMLQRNADEYQQTNAMYAARVTDRVRAVIAGGVSAPEGFAQTVWRATRYHPFATSAAVFGVAMAFAHQFLRSRGHVATARSCDVCRGALADHSTPPILLDGDTRAEAHHATFWYYRIHWINSSATPQEHASRTQRMSASAQQGHAMYQRHAQCTSRCASCAFVVFFSRVLGRYAQSHCEGTIGVNPSHGVANYAINGTTVTLDDMLFCVERYWDEGIAFFEHAFGVLKVPRNERAQHYGVALCRRGAGDGGAGLVVRDVPEELEDALLTRSERRASQKHCVIEAPSALGGIVGSSMAHFTTRDSPESHGVLNTASTNGGRSVVVALQREELGVMQCAVAPVVALDRKCYMDTRDMHRCSGALTALRNILCGTAHELYYGMQWMRRCLFRRSKRDGHMFSPSAGAHGITLYRMLPRLLSSLPPDALANALASPYHERNQLLVRNFADRSERERSAGVELFYSDTVDLQRVTRNLHSDMFLVRRNRRLAEIVPRRYDLRFVRDRHLAASKIHSKRGQAAKMRALLQVHAAELRARTFVLAQLRESAACENTSDARSSLKRTSKDVFAAQFQKLLDRRQQHALRDALEADSKGETKSGPGGAMAVAALLASIGPPSDSSATSSEDKSRDVQHAYRQAAQSIPLLTPRSLAFASAVRKTQTSIYASLHAFILPVDARVCVHGPTLALVWQMLLHNSTLWREYRILAAFLSEIIMASPSERKRIRAQAERASRGAREPPWMTWVRQRREYVFQRLRTECYATAKQTRGSRRSHVPWNWAGSTVSWRVFDDAEEEAEPDADSSGNWHKSDSQHRPRRADRCPTIGRLAKWCPCSECGRVSFRHQEGMGDKVSCVARDMFHPVPPLAWGAPSSYERSFEHAQKRAEQECPGIPERHLILPKAVVCFPDLTIPTHYLLYEFAVDARVSAELRRSIFLGTKALPRSGRMECVAPNRDVSALHFSEANDALRSWASTTIAMHDTPNNTDLAGECTPPRVAQALDTPAPHSNAKLDALIRKFNITAEDLALVMEATAQPDKHTAFPGAYMLGEAHCLLQNTEMRHLAYSEWLRDVLVEWQWSEANYPPCTGLYGSMVLQSGDAVPVAPLYSALFSGELLSRLDFRTLQRHNQTLDDALEYNARREALYQGHLDCALKRERLLAQLSENTEIDTELVSRATQAIDATNAQRLKAHYERVLRSETVQSGADANNAAHLFLDTTMRENMCSAMVQAHAPVTEATARTVMVLCARDPALCPPFLVSRHTTLRPWGAPSRMVPHTKLRAIEPDRCVPVCYSECVSRVIMQHRPINKALAGIASSTVAASNTMDRVAGTLRAAEDIQTSQRHLRRLHRHTARTLAVSTPMLTPQLLACLDAIPYRTITDSALADDFTPCAEDALNYSLPALMNREALARQALAPQSIYAQERVWHVKC